MITALREELGPCWLVYTLAYALVCGVAAGLMLVYFGMVR